MDHVCCGFDFVSHSSKDCEKKSGSHLADDAYIFMNFNGSVVKQNGKDPLSFHNKIRKKNKTNHHQQRVFWTKVNYKHLLKS